MTADLTLIVRPGVSVTVKVHDRAAGCDTEHLRKVAKALTIIARAVDRGRQIDAHVGPVEVKASQR